MVVIVDYGMGNIFSVQKRLEILKQECIVSNDPALIAKADRLILPGVGHFAVAMENLRKSGLIEVLNRAVLIDKVPILGICLGMQLMCTYSEEGSCEGLGWFNANVVKFKFEDSFRFKVPHTGWNQIHISKNSQLMNDIPEGSNFYFIHSYFLKLKEETDQLNFTSHEFNFTSAIEKENIFGVQYHPEKSHDLGLQLLKNFLFATNFKR